ncbi:ABC transporter ATP-binding protein [Alkalihalobacillus alcalophilus ATCC 27647 = CGMCC 1.3604]|uniref:ABC transporter ATP-binding protein n=1 Tax=Alkalihalobacillus alcalophilus ATCC 27647 = CGMCC 1.3604 TaxID=1218173 RepID=J8TEI6_ALKAL|nr:ATP-binding cassette domain-containing protein [Alkalihalobacillus alcalophilus]AFV25991.1 sodium ion efflux transporter [Alkalihalobacillus alcalophilus ATCC 27647 = CGMCC 1.3604]KGA98612.1 ABC transporter ATP-binding protein [Alkalihalobacillus alcalophilus ATCC 27647 = CGMCC 1.3604]MED1560455.1 ATP-binding cassette domain-containing protein [Alkalihalobacillus alcalophilus]THG90903.1 ABC transporter ATP-binding protein [Alkalihalobacillus alcalophilus ATCC 27647 = CGMCC 1.3604]
MDPVLKVKGLGKAFKDKKVISDITFEVHKGEIMAILGPNGAGKSTSIRNIMGIMYPDEGEISFLGEQVKHVPRAKIGYLPEERGLYKSVKVIDLLLYFADLKDYPLKKARERALDLLKKLGLEGKDKSSIEELSKGMAQKVQFIASIIHEPELLILDEPFSGLDPVSQELFKKEIKQLANNGTAILLSSHQMNIVEELCDRLFMIHRGQKVIYGSLDEVKRKFANFKCTIIGENELSVLERLNNVERVEQTGDRSTLFLTKDVQINDWIRQLSAELDIQELTIDRISLHEIFIDIASDRLNGKEFLNA